MSSSMFTSFSGADIKAYFQGVEIVNLVGLSVSVNREVKPVFCMGSPDFQSISKGKRGIAGSIVMNSFDKEALKDYKNAFKGDSQLQYQEDKVQPAKGGDDTITVGSRAKDAQYADQLPPFTVVLVGHNEDGNAIKMVIENVVLMSEGTGVSIDDNVQEVQYTFIAKAMSQWVNVTPS